MFMFDSFKMFNSYCKWTKKTFYATGFEGSIPILFFFLSDYENTAFGIFIITIV